ncbi:hypothetical protein [Pontibacter rugosus]|uniref:Ig-like domain-containing protein n=1 Tax=Pontibacter rugosus TaxID=1745966 RepID=A0ABW3SM97_9BACT
MLQVVSKGETTVCEGGTVVLQTSSSDYSDVEWYLNEEKIPAHQEHT